MKMRKIRGLLAILILIGVTIYYDVDSEFGGVWINSSTEDCTILAYPKTNRVVWYDTEGRVRILTYETFMDAQGKEILKNLVT